MISTLIGFLQPVHLQPVQALLLAKHLHLLAKQVELFFCPVERLLVPQRQPLLGKGLNRTLKQFVHSEAQPFYKSTYSVKMIQNVSCGCIRN